MGEEQENSTGVRSRGTAGEQHMGEEQCGFLFVCVFVVEYICVCLCVFLGVVLCVLPLTLTLRSFPGTISICTTASPMGFSTPEPTDINTSQLLPFKYTCLPQSNENSYHSLIAV